MISLGKISPVEFVKAVYELSLPQGMGFLHYQEGGLSDEDAKQCIDPRGGISMDYVHGRACKMNVDVRKDGTIEIPDAWYDHTNQQLKELCAKFGVDVSPVHPHNTACNCIHCQVNRDVEVAK